MRKLDSSMSDLNNGFNEELEYVDRNEEENEIYFMEYYSIKSNTTKDILNNFTNINQYKEGLAGQDGIKLGNSTKIIETHTEINDDLGIIKSIS